MSSFARSSLRPIRKIKSIKNANRYTKNGWKMMKIKAKNLRNSKNNSNMNLKEIDRNTLK